MVFDFQGICRYTLSVAKTLEEWLKNLCIFGEGNLMNLQYALLHLLQCLGRAGYIHVCVYIYIFIFIYDMHFFVEPSMQESSFPDSRW